MDLWKFWITMVKRVRSPNEDRQQLFIKFQGRLNVKTKIKIQSISNRIFSQKNNRKPSSFKKSQRQWIQRYYLQGK